MFQANEIITLLIGLIGLVIFLRSFKPDDFPGLQYLKYGFVFLLCANFFTVVEGIFLNSFFNLLEHSGYALSGLMLSLGFWKLSKAYTGSSIDEGGGK
jgi:hypothetical protein